MSRVARFPVVGSATMLLLGFALLVGCQRKDSAATSSDNSGFTNHANEFRPRAAPVGPTNFSVPFHGVIKAKEQRDLMLNSAEITYTVNKGKIRREAVRTAP